MAHKMPLFKSHQRVPVSAARTENKLCGMHEQPLDQYCANCDKLICKDCVQLHVQHALVAPADRLGMISNEIQDQTVLAIDLSKMYEDAHTNIAKELDELNKVVANTCPITYYTLIATR